MVNLDLDIGILEKVQHRSGLVSYFLFSYIEVEIYFATIFWRSDTPMLVSLDNL